MCRCESVCSHQRSVALSVFLRLHNHNSNHNVLTPLPLKRAHAYSCSQVASYGKPANAQSISGKKRTAGPGMHLWATQVPRKLTGDVALHQHFIRSIRKTQRIRVAQDPSTAVYFSNDDHSTMSVDSSTFSAGGLARRVLVPEKSTAHTYKSDYTESWAHMTVFACWIRSFMLDADGNPVPTNSHVATIVRPKFQWCLYHIMSLQLVARRCQAQRSWQMIGIRLQRGFSRRKHQPHCELRFHSSRCQHAFHSGRRVTTFGCTECDRATSLNKSKPFDLEINAFIWSTGAT